MAIGPSSGAAAASDATERRLVAFLTPQAVDSEAVLAALQATLPAYMVPRDFKDAFFSFLRISLRFFET